MSQTSEHITLSNNGVDGIITPYYLWLEGHSKPGLAPGGLWKLRDKKGKEAQVQSRLPTEDKIVVRVEATGEEPTEHEISRTFDKSLHLSIRKSNLMGNQIIWTDGLTIPTAWFLNQPATSISIQEADGLNERLKLTIRFDGFCGNHFEVPDWSPLPKKELTRGKFVFDNVYNTDVIKVSQTIVGEKSGIGIAALSLYFAIGRGIIRAEGRIINRSIKYHLAEKS